MVSCALPCRVHKHSNTGLYDVLHNLPSSASADTSSFWRLGNPGAVSDLQSCQQLIRHCMRADVVQQLSAMKSRESTIQAAYM